MHFKPLTLDGAWLITPEAHRDERGTFQRTFCVEEFAAHGLEKAFPQHSLSQTPKLGTLRGMHFQCAPHDEVKVVRCVAGAIFDVIVDLRFGSPTFRRWQGIELSASNGHQVYVPRGFAHGHLTLTDDASVFYLISEPYSPRAASGARWDDPALGITWPFAPTLMSERDRTWPLLAL